LVITGGIKENARSFNCSNQIVEGYNEGIPMDHRRMCSQCRAFITSSDRVCPYCDAPVGARAIDQRRAADAMAGFIDGDRFLTNVLLVLNAGLYLATLFYSSQGRAMGLDPSGNALFAFGGKEGYAILRDLQWWRLITAGFLHGGILHIGMNSWVLWDLGPRIDEVFGTYRYIAIYFFATLLGFAASLFWTPTVLSIGASAGISGLVGAMVGLGTRERNSMIGRERSRYIQWMVMILVQGFIISGIDNAAHIGGFIGGFIIAYVAGSRGHAHGDDTLWKSAAWVALSVTAYSFFRMVQQLLK
jgi:rhomboid protease GluP